MRFGIWPKQPDDPHTASRWTATDYDAAGQGTAHYAAIDSGCGSQFGKRLHVRAALLRVELQVTQTVELNIKLPEAAACLAYP
jgi:hypothetical protein